MQKNKGGKQSPAPDSEWNWRKRYRVWEANRKVFLYPENWIEPDLRLPAPFRRSLRELVTIVCDRCGTQTKRPSGQIRAQEKRAGVLFTGRSRKTALVAAQTIARNLGSDLYRIDLSAVVSKYIGETEKNLGRVFKAARKSGSILFFDEADALFGKRTEVKDSHDRYANIEVNYLLQQIEQHDGLAILTAARKSNIDSGFLRRLRFVIALPSPAAKKPPVPKLSGKKVEATS